ncbi:MAG: hypothetical protein WCC38_06380 [Pseudonocardiaceae bacterium]
MHGTRDEVVPLPPPFEIVRRGFHPQQVTDHVTALKARVATIGTERNVALQRAEDLNEQGEKLRREAAEATRQLDELRKEASETAAELDRLQRLPLTGATGRIQRMLQIAEDEAAELKAATEQEITSLRDSARAEADRLLTQTRQQCERLEAESNALRQAVEAETAGDQLLAQARQECERLEAESNARRQAVEAETAARHQQAEQQAERLLTEARQECERLEAESNARRQAVEAETAARHQQAEQQAERDIARREAETDAWIQDYQTHSVAALHLIMRMAGERLSNRVLKVTRQMVVATQLRSEVTDQLSEVHRLLVGALGVADQLTPTERAGLAEQAGLAELVELAAQTNGTKLPAAAPDQTTARFGLHP